MDNIFDFLTSFFSSKWTGRGASFAGYPANTTTSKKQSKKQKTAQLLEKKLLEEIVGLENSQSLPSH